MLNINIFGPGLMVAATAIGASHLIQSTRAGVNFGLDFLLLCILINIIKYPFIQYGMRYYHGTNENLLAGYKKLGWIFLFFYFLITILTTVTGIAAISHVSAGILKFIAETLMPFKMHISYWNALIIAGCITLHAIGGYKVLRQIINYLMLILFVTTSLAFCLSLFYYGMPDSGINHIHNTFSWNNLAFIIAFMGWMPGPVDLSVYYSVWRQEKADIGEVKNEHNDNYDFNLGYIITVIIAIMFITIGGSVLHNSGQQLSNNTVIFAKELISLFTKSIGWWSWPIISLCAFSCIFATCLTLIDVRPKILAISSKLMVPKLNISLKILHIITMILIGISSILFTTLYKDNFKQLVDLAIIIAFLSTPFIASMNCLLVNSNRMPEKYKPSKSLNIFSIFGIAVITAVSAIFLLWKLQLIGI